MANNQFFQMMYLLEAQKKNKQRGEMTPAQIMSTVLNRDRLGMSASSEHVKSFNDNTTEENYNAVMKSLEGFKKDAILPEAEGYINSQMVNVNNIMNVSRKSKVAVAEITNALDKVDPNDKKAVLDLQNRIVQAAQDGYITSPRGTYYLRAVDAIEKENNEDMAFENMADILELIAKDKDLTPQEGTEYLSQFARKPYKNMEQFRAVASRIASQESSYAAGNKVYREALEGQIKKEQLNLRSKLDVNQTQIQRYFDQIDATKNPVKHVMLQNVRALTVPLENYGGKTEDDLGAFAINDLYSNTLESVRDLLYEAYSNNRKPVRELDDGIQPAWINNQGIEITKNKDVFMEKGHPQHLNVVSLYTRELENVYRNAFKEKEDEAPVAGIVNELVRQVELIQMQGKLFPQFGEHSWDTEMTTSQEEQAKKIRDESIHNLNYFNSMEGRE